MLFLFVVYAPPTALIKKWIGTQACKMNIMHLKNAIKCIFLEYFLLDVLRHKIRLTFFLEDSCSITKSSKFFQNRSGFQCQHRWQKVLSPELIKGPWTKEEDQRVTCSYYLISLCRWTSFFLPNTLFCHIKYILK